VLEAAVLVDLEHKGPDLNKLALLLVDYCNHVVSFSGQVVKCAKVHVLQPHVNEITELLGILEISVIDELHKDQIIEEKLALWVLHDLICSHLAALKLGLNFLSNRSGLCRELEALKEIREIVAQDENCVGEHKYLPELLQLFG
jgi:hypothetical protein